jgi:hypothetical protein
VFVGGAKGTFGTGWDHDDEDDEEDFERAFAPYRTTGHTAILAGAGLELVNLVVLRPLVWRAAIDRAAAGGAASTVFAPSVFVARDRRGKPVPALGVIGTF